MGRVQCCGGNHSAKSFKLLPMEGFLQCEVDYLEECPVCGHTVLVLSRIDMKHRFSQIRKTNEKARKFYDKIRPFIIYEKKYRVYKGGKFYLNYSEYGVKKKCYSNFSTLKLGLFENQDIIKIKEKAIFDTSTYLTL